MQCYLFPSVYGCITGSGGRELSPEAAVELGLPVFTEDMARDVEVLRGGDCWQLLRMSHRAESDFVSWLQCLCSNSGNLQYPTKLWAFQALLPTQSVGGVAGACTTFR